jgi:PleD family two-component response regulator
MIPAPDTSIGLLFSRADNALYYGKEQGKNRVQAWDESIPDRAP